jgi:hypothetical protein
LRARSRRRKAPARKASTKARYRTRNSISVESSLAWTERAGRGRWWQACCEGLGRGWLRRSWACGPSPCCQPRPWPGSRQRRGGRGPGARLQ